MGPETSSWDHLWGFATAIQGDRVADGYIGLYATHQYSGTVTYKTIDRNLWETEFSTFDAFDPNIGNSVNVAKAIHEAIVSGNVTAWHYWWLQGLNADNEGLLGHKGASTALTKRLYAMGNFSRFVRPGWVRLGTKGAVSGLLVSAYSNTTTGDFAIVAINSTGGNATATFGISGPTFRSVSPYVTSGTIVGMIGTDGNLSLGSAAGNVPTSIPASSNAFSATIPSGITTFVGTAH
jgi:glucuronoarabinoxylan endo-1,4-beta-xylanase